jgi:hypothetical protein
MHSPALDSTVQRETGVVSNGSSTGTGLRPDPGKDLRGHRVELEQRRHRARIGAASRRWPENVKAARRRLRVDLGSELIERRAPFDADGRDRRRSEFVGARRQCRRSSNGASRA